MDKVKGYVALTTLLKSVYYTTACATVSLLQGLLLQDYYYYSRSIWKTTATAAASLQAGQQYAITTEKH